MLKVKTEEVLICIYMFRPLSWIGLAGGLTVSIAALSGPQEYRSAKLTAAFGLIGGSAVASLLSENGIRRKYRGIVDVQAEIRNSRSLALRELDDIKRVKESTEKEIDKAEKASQQIVDQANERLESLQNEVVDMSRRKVVLTNSENDLRERLKELNQDVEDALDLDDSGFAARRYPGLDSQRLSNLLKVNRKKQKDFAKKLLDECKLSQVTLGDSSAQGKAFVRQTLKSLLRGFNGECDAAISTLKHSNDSTVLGKIERAFDFYAKQASTRIEIPWSQTLQKLKDDEAYLIHENALAKQAEREEQLELRRQEREEEKARRDAEEAKEAAEREAEKYEELLAKAIKEAAENDQSDEYLEKIKELERRVKEAEENKERAISRAQMTRSGHVYVISNIGSFGHNVFKVGMTRRLEPTDRVRELGDASVPFPFDIHAMIFTEDAPGLETAIHRRVNSRRLNLVNLRREFFTITWDELVEEAEIAAKEIGVSAEIRWTRIAEAEQYRQSVSERASTEQPIRFLEQKRLEKSDSIKTMA